MNHYASHMDFRFSQLQLFITVVESDTLTRASERLHVTQPYVTKMIRQMEDQLGIILFVRSHRKLLLTPAGKELYTHWKNIIQYYEHSIENAHVIQKGNTDRITIGVCTLSEPQSLLRFAEKLKTIAERVEVHIEAHSMLELWNLLKENKVDGILQSGHTMGEEPDKSEYVWKMYEESYLAIYIHDSNPLYRKEEITIKDLRAESFIALSSESDLDHYRLLNTLCNEAGFSPRISCYAPNELSCKANLFLGNGVFLADSVTDMTSEHVKRFILKDYRNDIFFIMKANNKSSALNKIFKAL